MEQLEAILKSSPHSTNVLFTCTTVTGRGLQVHVWDLHNGGTLRTFRCKGENECSCICLAGNDYILCALKNKPLVIVWKIDKEQVHVRFACNGLVSHMICDPSGTHCIASIGEKINIWEVSSGLFLAQVSRHYQPVTSLHYITSSSERRRREASDGSGCFVSGGKDGLVILWNIGNILADYKLHHSAGHPNEPRPPPKSADVVLHVWSSHSMPITALTSTVNHTSNDHTHSFIDTIVITGSMDQSCKFFSLSSGDLICTVLFNAPVMSLALTRDWLYVGVASGEIKATPLFLPLEKVKEIGRDRYVTTFKGGHKSPVTALLVSYTGHSLISSSSKETSSKVWNINSNQIIMTVNHKGPVISSLIRQDVWRFSQLHSHQVLSSSPLILTPFAKIPSYKHDAIMEHNITLHRRPVHELSVDKLDKIDQLTGENFLEKYHFCTIKKTLIADDEKSGKDLESEVNQMRHELTELKEVNKALYSLACEHLLNEKTF